MTNFHVEPLGVGMEPVHRWQSGDWGPLSLESIRALHTPPHHFRISLSRTLPIELRDGETMGGAFRAGRIYVLAGSVQVSIGGRAWELNANEWADLSEGGLVFRLLKSEPLEYVMVWEIPPEYRILPQE